MTGTWPSRHIPPEPARPDARTSLFGVWRVRTPGRQRATVAAIAAAWERRTWPSDDLLSYNVFADTDGDALLHYSQWSTNSPRPQDPSWKDDVDAAVPGIERAGVTAYRLYRGHRVLAQEPGCVVVVTRELETPDPGSSRRLVDALFDSTAGAPSPSGLISAHFFVSLDGSRVLNYAEWSDEDAHSAAVNAVPRQAVGPSHTWPGLDDADWRRAHTWPGLKSTVFSRFHFRLGLLPAPVNRTPGQPAPVVPSRKESGT